MRILMKEQRKSMRRNDGDVENEEFRVYPDAGGHSARQALGERVVGW